MKRVLNALKLLMLENIDIEKHDAGNHGIRRHGVKIPGGCRPLLVVGVTGQQNQPAILQHFAGLSSLAPRMCVEVARSGARGLAFTGGMAGNQEGRIGIAYDLGMVAWVMFDTLGMQPDANKAKRQATRTA